MEPYNNVNHMPYTGQPGSPEPMAYIPRTEEAPTAWKWGEKSASLSQKESAHASQSDPICTSEGCPKFQSMGLDYEPYNDYNHIPYSGSPGYHSPISFIPRSDKPPPPPDQPGEQPSAPASDAD